MPDIAKAVSDTVAFGANCVTLLIGLIALWGFVFHRKKIFLAIKVLLSSYTNERVKRLKETLGKLDSLSFEEKEDRAEIYALLGQVSGQISILATEQNGIKKIQNEISDLLAKKSQLNEASKRRIVYELHGNLDKLSFNEINNLLE